MKKQIFIVIFMLTFSLKCFSFDNYYKMLGVPENASSEDIKKGYRKMAMKYHPDRNAGSLVAGEIFKKVQGAYDVLSDPQKRAQFDKQLRTQPKSQPTKAQAQKAQPQPKPAADNAKKHFWENFTKKKEAPSEQAKAEPKPEPKPQTKPEVKPEQPQSYTKTEAPKTDTYDFKPKQTFTADTGTTSMEKAFQGDTSVVKPKVETPAPFKNPKLDMYKAPSCSKGFLGTVIDTLI